jgi:hypothetical protein
MTDLEWLDLDPDSPAAKPDTGGAAGADARPIGSRLCRLVAIAGLLLACAAAVAFTVRGRPVTRTVVAAPSGYRGVDAEGCPVQTSCQLSFLPLGILTAVVDRAFPGAAIIDGQSVYDATNGHLLRASVTMRSREQVVVWVVSQCLPDDRPVSIRTVTSAASASDPAATDVLLIRPGRTGCSDAVAAQLPKGMDAPMAALESIAAAAQLP